MGSFFFVSEITYLDFSDSSPDDISIQAIKKNLSVFQGESSSFLAIMGERGGPISTR